MEEKKPQFKYVWKHPIKISDIFLNGCMCVCMVFVINTD